MDGDTQTTLPERGPKDPAHKTQEVFFIVTDRRYYRHKTYARAQAEKAYLSAANPDQQFRCLRMLNVPKERIGIYEAAPSMLTALRDLLALVESAEMSSRDMEPHEFEAIRDDAERQARAAIAQSTNTNTNTNT